MLFNSFAFLLFFVTLYVVYWGGRKQWTLQNYWLLIGSYIFYACWDWRFLSLIITSTLLDFWVGGQIAQTPDSASRKHYLRFSIIFNLGVLAFFKYFNFFIESFTDLLYQVGLSGDFTTLNIILPVGISFYTFQTLSYTIDIYRKELKPVKSLANFALYVSFFPQLVAGPIERATHLLPQINSPRTFNISQQQEGLYLILWGLFKKVVIADNLAIIVNTVFNNYEAYSGLDLGIAVLAFAFQIYGDFSGYTDMARGIAKLLGFELMLNFRLPYFAKNPSDFWRRWHISLSTWLRDYLYIPLGGNRGGQWFTFRNLFLTMLLGGLWHGAAWNFVIWGAYHGILLIGYKVVEDYFKKKELPMLKNTITSAPFRSIIPYQKIISILLMFLFTLLGWLIFRADSIGQLQYFLTKFNFTQSEFTLQFTQTLLFFIVPLFFIQIVQAHTEDLLIVLKQKNWKIGVFYSFLLIWIIVFAVRESTEFIYFQF